MYTFPNAPLDIVPITCNHTTMTLVTQLSRLNINMMTVSQLWKCTYLANTSGRKMLLLTFSYIMIFHQLHSMECQVPYQKPSVNNQWERDNSLVWCLIQVFAWRDWEKPSRISVKFWKNKLKTRRWRRCSHLLDDLKKNKSHRNPQDVALDGTPWLTCFGKISEWKKFISFISVH